MCLTWQPVADQRLLLPMISQSQIISVHFNWLWMQSEITHRHLTYWCYWRLTDVQITLFWSLADSTQVTYQQGCTMWRSFETKKMVHQRFYRNKMKSGFTFCLMIFCCLSALIDCLVLPQNKIRQKWCSFSYSPSCSHWEICELPVYKT